MRPTRWRRSTHVVIGVAVLLRRRRRGRGGRVRHHRRPVDQRRRRPSNRRPRSRPPNPASRPSPTPHPSRRRTGWPPRWRRSSPIPNLGTLTGRVTDAIDRRAAVGAGRRRADAAGVDQQGADHRRGAADPRPRRAADHHGAHRPGHARGWSCSRAAVTRRCRRPPPARPTWYRDAARISDLADQVRTQRHRRRRRCRSTSAPTAGRPWRRAGIRRHRRRRHRADGVGDARRRPHPAGQRRLAAVQDARARRRPRAGRRARGRSRDGHGAATAPRRRPGRSRRCSRRR